MTIASTDLLPVNAYDPAVEDFEQRVHDAVRSDLSTLGEVDVSGTIVVTKRNGVLFQDVVATIEHPALRVLLKVQVDWDEESRRLIYRNASGAQFTPAGSAHYGETGMTEEEEGLVAGVFSRIGEHSALGRWGGFNNYMKQSAIFFAVPCITALTGVGIESTVDLMSQSLETAVSVATVGVGFAGFFSRWGYEEMRHHRLTHDVERWNADRKKVLTGSFTSKSEESGFMDAFYAFTEQHGLSDPSSLQVTSRHRPDSLSDEISTELRKSRHVVCSNVTYRTFFLEFTARRGSASPEWFLWDGRNLLQWHFSNRSTYAVIPVG